MKFIIPNNIFATLFILSIDEAIRPEILVSEASLLSNKLNSDESMVGLIPSFDLISNRGLFISSKFGIGFEGWLSNTYLYFSSVNGELNNILLRGDISTNEAILSKLVFKERYDILPEFVLDASKNFEDNNYLIAGSENWVENIYENGTSFSEQISELINSPYINFVLASKSELAIREFHSNIGEMNKSIISNLDEILNKIGLSTNVNKFVKEEINSIYFDFTEYENHALRELLQLAYFHQIVEDIFELKFI